MSDPSGQDTLFPETSGDAAAARGFPWPPPEDASVVGALVETWRRAVIQPVDFFRAMPPVARVGAALLYYLVIGILASAIDLFWTTLLPPTDPGALGDVLGTAGATSPLVDFLLSPLMLLFSILLSAGITHLLVLALVPGNNGFGTTLRTFAYAYSPALFAVVPRWGSIVAFLWMTVLSVIGIREAHRTSTGRAATAVLIPVLIAALFLLFGYLLLRSGALLTAP